MNLKVYTFIPIKKGFWKNTGAHLQEKNHLSFCLHLHTIWPKK